MSSVFEELADDEIFVDLPGYGEYRFPADLFSAAVFAADYEDNVDARLAALAALDAYRRGVVQVAGSPRRAYDDAVTSGSPGFVADVRVSLRGGSRRRRVIDSVGRKDSDTMSDLVRRFNPHEEPDHVPAGPGRPRARGHGQKVIDAALRLIDDERPVTINALVEESGVSRAAIYRRWPSITLLIAEALDVGRPAYEVDVSGDPKEVMKNILFDRSDEAREAYTQRRFRKRVEIVMIDRDVQMAYWKKHVSKRRHVEAQALQAGIDRGLLRADLNVEAALDALNGIFYYQVITRGVSNYEPDVIARCEDAFDMVWRGMQA